MNNRKYFIYAFILSASIVVYYLLRPLRFVFPVKNGKANGEEITATTGPGEVIATESGRISLTGFVNDGFYAYLVHRNGYESRYRNMGNITVTENQKVKKGDVIGYLDDGDGNPLKTLKFYITQNGTKQQKTFI
jgi:septal ring factor EnvC (AmiA/AmiB activator)